MDNSHRFFENKECQYHPCHKDVEHLNCMFCYCPLYCLGDNCGGSFRYTEQGIKDCSTCIRPHLRENYDQICKKMDMVLDLVKKV